MPVTGNTTGFRKRAVSYQLLTEPGALRMQYGQTTGGTTYMVVVAADDWENFRQDMLGWTEAPGGTLLRTLPEKSLYDDTQYCLQCDLVSAITPSTGVPAAFEGPSYELAHVQLQFAAPLYEVKEDGATLDREWERYTVWTVRGAANNEKIPGGGYKFVDDAVAANRVPLGEVGVKTGRLIHLTAKWMDVPTPPYGTLTAAANKVNTDALDWEGGSYDPGTVLFESWSADKRRNSRGEFTYDLTYNFAARADGRTWNSFWKSGAAGYVSVSSDGTSSGDPLFEDYDLDLLFRVP